MKPNVITPQSNITETKSEKISENIMTKRSFISKYFLVSFGTSKKMTCVIKYIYYSILNLAGMYLFKVNNGNTKQKKSV